MTVSNVTNKPTEEDPFELDNYYPLLEARCRVSRDLSHLFNGFDFPTVSSDLCESKRKIDESLGNGHVQDHCTQYRERVGRNSPCFKVPVPESTDLTESISDTELKQRKERYKSAAIFSALGANPFSDLAIGISPFNKELREGLTPEQTKSLETHIRRVDEEISIRKFMIIPVMVGKATHTAIETVEKFLSKAGEKFCSQSSFQRSLCTANAEAGKYIVEFASGLVPDKVKKFVSGNTQAYHSYVEAQAGYFQAEYGIDKDETRSFYSGLIDISAGPVAAAAKVPFRAFKKSSSTASQVVEKSRISYASGYEKSVEDFVVAKEFSGTLSKPLTVVQYHSEKPLGSGRSWKWFMPVAEANKQSTIEEVKNCAALLSRWGERSYVSVARIPADEKVKFLHGRAAPQVDKVSSEVVTGGGVQYRFADFDPKWIQETRQIPEKPFPRSNPTHLEESLSNMVLQSEKAYLRDIPGIPFNTSYEQRWKELALEVNVNIQTQYRTSLGNGVVKVGKGEQSVVLKTSGYQESLEEMFGSHFFSSLKLKSIEFSPPINMYRDAGNLILVKPYAAGKTLNSLVTEQIRKSKKPHGKFSIQSSSIADAVEQVATAYNELKFVSSKHRIPLPSQKKSLFFGPESFREINRDANRALQELLPNQGIRLPMIHFRDDQMKAFSMKWLRPIEFTGFSLGDVGLSNFAYLRSQKKLTYFDGQFLSHSVNRLRQPIGMFGNDLSMFVSDFLEVSISNGMTFADANFLLQHFLKHLKDPINPAHLLHGKIDAVRNIAEGISFESSVRIREFEKLIEQINSDIGKLKKD